jgi:RHS repeat-associated protein
VGQAEAQQFLQSYTYDRYGNRTINQGSTWGTGINNKQFTVDPSNTNRLMVPSGQIGTMTYDNAGNLITDTYTGAGTRTYDGENRMLTAWGGNNQWQFYTYDANGSRVRRKIDNVETWQVYGMDGEVLAEYAASGAPSSPQKEYGYRNGQLLVSGEPAAQIKWLVADQLGTPRIILDKTGALANVKRHDYLPFGEELLAGQGNRTFALGYSGDNVRQKFTQKEKDNETGLDYFSARYHASTQGRFTSSDPLITSGKVAVPQSWNRYTYCLNNPLAFVDPTGLEWRTNDESGALRWYEKDDERTGSTEYTNEYYQNGNQWVRLNMSGPTHNTQDSAFGRRGWDFVEAGSVPGSYNGANMPSAQAGPGDSTGALQLLFEYITGTGPTDREFGPSDYMTQGMMTSPDVTAARQKFIQQGGGTYVGGVRFGLNAEDGPFEAGSNMPRQFVGSFNITITQQPNGDAQFVLQNATTLKSALYQIPGVQPVERSTMHPLSTKTQTYFWTERGVIK